MELFMFALLGLVSIGSSLAMIGHKNPVYSALYMVVTFATTAVMFVLLKAPFIAAVQIIIYAGAVVVLFLFVVMFLNLKAAVLLERRRGPLLLAFVLAGLVAGELAAVVATGAWPDTDEALVPPGFGSVASVATVLFTRYLVPFEIASIILLTGMVGALALARRESITPETAYDLRGPDGGREKPEAGDGGGPAGGPDASVEPAEREPVPIGVEVHR
jgi:NADH-quinone oxidoreductase subunit J